MIKRRLVVRRMVVQRIVVRRMDRVPFFLDNPFPLGNKFFSEGIKLEALSPNFDIHIDFHTLTSFRGQRAVRLKVFIKK
jgi:hypothetical protein